MNPIQFLRRHVANLPMARKFIVLCTLIALGVILLAVAAARLQYLNLIDARKQSVKTQVDMGLSVMQHYADLAKRGEMTQAQAQAAAKGALADMKTNGGVDYFFIVDPQMRIVMHPKRAVGTDMSGYRSDAGEYVYRDIQTAVRSGDGFSYYTAPKPGKSVQLPKISYAALYPQWNWVLAMGVYAEDIQAQAMGFTKILTVIGGGLVALVVGLCWLIAGAIVAPLRGATRTAEAIASGRFDNPIKVESRDETGQLMTSMQQMQTQLQRFNGEMQILVRLQQGEDISHRMPEDFPGDYGTLAHGMNTALFEHLDAIVEAMAIMDEYGRGDLRRDMRRLPGQRAALHEALDVVKANLSAVNGDIARLADAAARGDFTARGDEARYAFAFKEMVEALNRLMRQADSGLADVGRIMGAIADGDLSQRVDVRYEGAFGKLADAANRTAEQLTGIVQGIQRAVGSINTAASEIASGNSDLSVRTEQQAASLEETAASMEELTSTVKQNADSARQANQLVLSTGEVAEHGGRAVEEVVATMASISAASARIADIIGVRRHRLPDQHPRAQCGGGSGTRRRTGPRLRRGGLGSALAGAAFGSRGQGDQDPDLRLGAGSGAGLDPGQPRRHHHDRGGRLGEAGHRHHGRDLRGQRRAERGHRPGQQDGDAAGRGHPAERGIGGRSQRGGQEHGRPGGGTGARGGGVPPRRRRRHQRGTSDRGKAAAGQAGGAGCRRRHQAQADGPGAASGGQATPDPGRAGGQRGVGRVLSQCGVVAPAATPWPLLQVMASPRIRGVSPQLFHPLFACGCLWSQRRRAGSAAVEEEPSRCSGNATACRSCCWR